MNSIVDFLARTIGASASRPNSSQGRELNQSDKKTQRVINPWIGLDGKEQFIGFDEEGHPVSFGSLSATASK